MSTRTAFGLYRNMLALASLCTLAACGGGGGGGEPAPSPPPGPPPARQISFTVSLEEIDVRRASNGESVVVDASSVVQNLTFEE
jgi:hypothetical protein